MRADYTRAACWGGWVVVADQEKEELATQCIVNERVVRVYNDIKALKKLLDDGIITQAEYDVKKQEILGIVTEEQRLALEAAEAERLMLEQERKRTKEEKIRGLAKRLAPLAALVVLVLAGVVYASGSEIRESRKNIEPYLQVLGSETSWRMELDLSDDLVEGSTKVVFMGVEGTVSYEADDREVVILKWKPNDTFTGDERAEFIESLKEYFGSEYEYDSHLVSGTNNWNTYTYTWQDERSGYEASVWYDFIKNVDDYDSDDKRLTVEWDSSKGSAYLTDSVDIK